MKTVIWRVFLGAVFQFLNARKKNNLRHRAQDNEHPRGYILTEVQFTPALLFTVQTCPLLLAHDPALLPIRFLSPTHLYTCHAPFWRPDNLFRSANGVARPKRGIGGRKYPDWPFLAGQFLTSKTTGFFSRTNTSNGNGVAWR